MKAVRDRKSIGPEEHHVYPIRRAEASAIRCSNAKCPNFISQGQEAFLDMISRKQFCDPCGKALRYHRKCALARGETIGSPNRDLE